MSQADAAAAFPALDTDLDGAAPGPPKRICIATPDILGPIKNGGIGTAYHHVARMLAAWGHEVVIAYVNGNAADAEPMAAARDLYAGFGVAFEPIAPRPGGSSPLARVPAPTWALLEWLRARKRPFDIVHVSEWRGLGYGPLLAKALGLDFGMTHFVVKGSSPTLWSLEGNRQLVSTEARCCRVRHQAANVSALRSTRRAARNRSRCASTCSSLEYCRPSARLSTR